MNNNDLAKYSVELLNNDLAKYVVGLLQQYAKENQCNVRALIDLSPLEDWLIVNMYVLKKESGEMKGKRVFRGTLPALAEVNIIALANVTKVELIEENGNGRVYVNQDIHRVGLGLIDEMRTLKIFITNKD